MGFGVPVADWLRGPLEGWVEDLLDPVRMKQEGFFSVDVVQQRWRELKDGRHPWQNHLWDVLAFQAWLRAG
jgi:asparagine synthase (glutamine-hydrolysing)